MSSERKERKEQSTKCDLLCVHPHHPFRYILSAEEKKVLFDVCNEFFDFDEEVSGDIKNFRYHAPAGLSNLHKRLVDFFDSKDAHEQTFFLRLSTCSPKDALYNIAPQAVKSDCCDTSETISSAIEFLHVGKSLQLSGDLAAAHCIKVLCYSDRVRGDLAGDNGSGAELGDIPPSVLLLPWKSTRIISETRCFVHEGKLVAASQYYSDFVNCYPCPPAVYKAMVKFFAEVTLPLPNCVVDLDISFGDTDDAGEPVLEIIECNALDPDSDSCLFSWGEKETKTGSEKWTGDPTIYEMMKMSKDPDYRPPLRFRSSDIKSGGRTFIETINF